jgi:hypothetical protein
MDTRPWCFPGRFRPGLIEAHSYFITVKTILGFSGAIPPRPH